MKTRIVLFCSLFAACSASPSDRLTRDAGVADAGPKVLRIETDVIASPGIGFAAPNLTEGSLELDLVGHGLADLQGIAFRVRYDPAVLTFQSLEQQIFLQELFEVREPTPGYLIVALSAVGASPGIAVDDAVIAHFTFTVVQRAESAVQLTRGLVLDVAGREIQASFSSGRLVY